MPFGGNVKLMRIKKNLSLQQLASLSGVSSSMLSKIERGEKTPTIRVASQIARALEVSLTYLLDDRFYANVAIVKKNQRKISFDPVSKIESFTVSPSGEPYMTEIFLQNIPKDASTGTFPPQGEGIRKYIVVTKGQIIVLINSVLYDLDEGDCLMFDANAPHEFSNSGDSDAQYYLIIDRYGTKENRVTVRKDNK